MSFIISSVVELSRFPVGSSARSISGLFISALAIATLCCCQPDNSQGLLRSFSHNQTFSSISAAASSLFFQSVHAYIHGSATFSSELSFGKR
jgi:hypothetical protein